MVKKMIHLEGAVVFLAMFYLYSFYEFKWWIFILFLFAPDISMIGYIADNRIGAIIYNLCHTYTVSVLTFFLGVFLQLQVFLIIGLIWTAHIGMDRLCGFGLKYKTRFKDTHLQNL